tara:strand:- start:4777 stop:5061 length:285 start_codon:yes stop_codon:yes gene_type:complete
MEKKDLLFKAQDAFWEVISDNHPEIKTGNFGPLSTFKFDEACERAYDIWIRENTECEHTWEKKIHEGNHFDEITEVCKDCGEMNEDYDPSRGST